MIPESTEGFEARWAGSYPVLGIETVVEATSAMVAPAVERAFGAWAEAPNVFRSERRVRLRITVTEGAEGMPSGHAPVEYRLESPRRVRATAPGSVAFADADGCEAWARVTRALVEDTDHFRYGIVEAMTYFLLSHLDRQPFHCAAVARGGTVALLSGPPGTGKSTLAYAALGRGLSVMADDLVWLQQRPTCRVWGLTPVIQLPESSTTRFPELAAVPTLVANGQRKLVVGVDAAGRPRSPVADRVAVCVLARGGTVPRLEWIPSADLAHTLESALQQGFDRFSSTIPALLGAFAPRGGWRLWLGTEPLAAAACLEELLESLDPTA